MKLLLWELKLDICMVSILLISENDELVFKWIKLLLLMMVLVKLLCLLCEGVIVVNVIVLVVVFFLNSVFCGLCNILIDLILIKLLINVFCCVWYILFMYKFIEDLKLKFCEDVLMLCIENFEFVMFWFWNVLKVGM